jgi:beta-glucosidase
MSKKDKMYQFPEEFLIGSATAAHQVEGGNYNCDFWAEEHAVGSPYAEKSGDACDHYHRFREDIALMAELGLKSYRFSIEWARVEPEEGEFSAAELNHYREVVQCCHEHGLKTIVTLHHFTSPRWLMRRGGWQNPETAVLFGRYARYVVGGLGKELDYVVTINEINIATMLKRMFADLNYVAPVGVEASKWTAPAWREDAARLCGTTVDQYFTIHMSSETDHIAVIHRAHDLAVEAVRELAPQAQVGASLSLSDIQAGPGGEVKADEIWNNIFGQYKDIVLNGDFVGVQNYTREIYGPDGQLPNPAGAEVTQCHYEWYPAGLAHVVRRVWEETGHKTIFITENGCATADDTRREAYLTQALHGVAACLQDGIRILGYTCWSTFDNFEWSMGYGPHFGIIAVDRKTQQRTAKHSAYYLGHVASTLQLSLSEAEHTTESDMASCLA